MNSGRGMKTREAAIQAGKIRIIPVMLTAVATILGFAAAGRWFNIDFISLFQHLNPKYFWRRQREVLGPLSWTIIFRFDILVLPYTDNGSKACT